VNGSPITPTAANLLRMIQKKETDGGGRAPRVIESVERFPSKWLLEAGLIKMGRMT
jgi:hypothetical protein